MRCPCCDGEGGFDEGVAGVPECLFYDCLYCDGECTVSLARFLYWHIEIIFIEEILPRYWSKAIKFVKG